MTLTHPANKPRDILKDWAILEADFQREYGINLETDLWDMSWRRFVLLLNNLSGDSVYILTLQARKEGKVAIEMNEVESDALLNSFFSS